MVESKDPWQLTNVWKSGIVLSNYAVKALRRQGSFDCVAASLREAAAPLRMTKFRMAKFSMTRFGWHDAISHVHETRRSRLLGSRRRHHRRAEDSKPAGVGRFSTRGCI